MTTTPGTHAAQFCDEHHVLLNPSGFCPACEAREAAEDGERTRRSVADLLDAVRSARRAVQHIHTPLASLVEDYDVEMVETSLQGDLERDFAASLGAVFPDTGEHPLTSRCECGGLARHAGKCQWRQGYGSHVISGETATGRESR